MKKRIALLACLICASAQAEFMDGNELLSRLRESGIRYAAGLGYVMGVHDALQRSNHCPPNNITVGQVADMVKNHLESMPQLRHLSADVHIGYVLKQAWPCAEQKGSRL